MMDDLVIDTWKAGAGSIPPVSILTPKGKSTRRLTYCTETHQAGRAE